MTGFYLIMDRGEQASFKDGKIGIPVLREITVNLEGAEFLLPQKDSADAEDAFA